MDPVTLALLVAIVVVGAAGGMIAAWKARPAVAEGPPVIVVTTREQSFHGVIVRQNRDSLTLMGAYLLAPGADPVPVGTVNIPANRVHFVQRDVDPVDVFLTQDRPEALPLPDNRHLRSIPPRPPGAAAEG